MDGWMPPRPIVKVLLFFCFCTSMSSLITGVSNSGPCKPAWALSFTTRSATVSSALRRAAICGTKRDKDAKTTVTVEQQPNKYNGYIGFKTTRYASLYARTSTNKQGCHLLSTLRTVGVRNIIPEPSTYQTKSNQATLIIVNQNNDQTKPN